MTLRCAVVGSGASGAAAVKALASTGAEITVFERGEPVKAPLETREPPESWGREYYSRLYADIRARFGLKFPPPKVHFGASPTQQTVDGWGRIWSSDQFGGLTNFWGGSALPYPAREMASWPIRRDELTPHYAAVASLIGIAGRADRLSDVLGGDFINRPPLWVPPVIDALEKAVNGAPPAAGGRVIAGTSRLALDTREGGTAAGCTYCGQCMLGCPRGSVYSADRTMRDWADAQVIRLVQAEVRSVEPDKGEVILADGERHGFDRVYLAAGCVESTRIAMNALGLDEGPVMTDNAVFTFPILYLGKPLGGKQPDRYFSLTNLIAVLTHSEPSQALSFIQVYPFFDHLWRYFLPPRAWPIFQPLARLARGRMLWGRLYLSGEHSQRYAFRRRTDDGIGLSLDTRGGLDALAPQWDAIRHSLGQQGFFVPPVPPLRHATSSHYAASLPLGGQWVTADGRLGARTFICDGAGIPTGSALSPTLTAMALSHRAASLSVG